MNTSTFVACALSSSLALVGCSSGGGCADVGCFNGAHLQISVPVGTDYSIEACIDAACTTTASPLHLVFQGHPVSIEIDPPVGNTSTVWFQIDQAIPDGVTLHVNVYKGMVGKVLGEHTDPITWSHPDASSCGGSCVTPTNLVVHQDP